jgi:lysophospholipase L1-like esterase
MITLPSGFQGQYPAVGTIKAACIGSSLTQQNVEVNSVADNISHSGRSWMAWLNAFLGWSMNIDVWVNRQDKYTLNNASEPGVWSTRNFSGANYGVSGHSSTQILNRIDDVIASSPDIVFLQQGTNNMIEVQTVISDVLSTITQLTDRGIPVVYLAITSRMATGSQSWAADRIERPYQALANQVLQHEIQKIPNAIFVDVNSYIIDELTALGETYTVALDTAVDGVHYADWGAFMIAKAIYDTVGDLLPKGLSRISSIGDVFDAANNPYGNIVRNPMMQTSSGIGTTNGGVGTSVTAGTGTASTSVARNFSCERDSSSTGLSTAVASVLSRGFGLGNWQRLEITAGGGGGNTLFNIRSSPTSAPNWIPNNYSLGDWVQASCDVQVSPFGNNALTSGFTQVALRFDQLTGSTPRGRSVCLAQHTGNLPNIGYTARLLTPPVQITRTDIDNFRPRIMIGVSDATTGGTTGIVDVGSVCIRKIQDPRTFWRV